MEIESYTKGVDGCQNEDRFLVADMGESGTVAVMADGMGGLSLGALAADTVVEAVSGYLRENSHACLGQDHLLHALALADQRIREESLRKRSKMGAAVAVAIVRGRHLSYTWQGNVRIYVQKDGQARQVTTDHIADIGYGRTALTRCIKGAGLRDDVPFCTRELEDGEKVIVCTDGMYMPHGDELGSLSIETLQSGSETFEDDASMIVMTP